MEDGPCLFKILALGRGVYPEILRRKAVSRRNDLVSGSEQGMMWLVQSTKRGSTY